MLLVRSMPSHSSRCGSDYKHPISKKATAFFMMTMATYVRPGLTTTPFLHLAHASRKTSGWQRRKDIHLKLNNEVSPYNTKMVANRAGVKRCQQCSAHCRHPTLTRLPAPILLLALRVQFLAAPFASAMRQASAAAHLVYRRRACSVLSALANERAAVAPPSRDEDPGDALQAPSHTGTSWNS